MPEIDIYSAKNNIESMLIGIYGVTGTGISGDDITVYTSSQEAADEASRRLGFRPYGYNIRFITTGHLRFL